MQSLAGGASSIPRMRQRPYPLLIESAQGARLTDADGNTYVDYAMGYGPLILGHSPQPIIEAISNDLSKGLRGGTINEGEMELAERVQRLVPCAQTTTFVTTGTEAVQLALRIARAGTGRVPICKFRSHYHGWADNVHVANSPKDDGPTTAGQDPLAARNTYILDWGDIDGLEHLLHKTPMAAVLMEAAAINPGCFAPKPGYLERVRSLCDATGTYLVFDEVITGFRLSLGGASQLYGVVPDLAVLGKAIGGGLPASAVTGSNEAMEPIASKRVLHRGTYNGNPTCMASGVACLDILEKSADGIYPKMAAQASALAEAINAAAQSEGVPMAVNRVEGTLQYFLGATQVPDLASLANVDSNLNLLFSAALLQHGVTTLPRGLMYLSAAHTDSDIALTVDAIEESMKDVRKQLGGA
jgi:glutamate-1-semialdehyde 2,1-aminomutase